MFKRIAILTAIGAAALVPRRRSGESGAPDRSGEAVAGQVDPRARPDDRGVPDDVRVRDGRARRPVVSRPALPVNRAPRQPVGVMPAGLRGV